MPKFLLEEEFMLVLYSGSGARGFNILGPHMVDDEYEILKRNASKLLRAKIRDNMAAILLERIPFELYDATNVFSDEFTVLHAYVSTEQYVEYTELNKEKLINSAFSQLADVFSEFNIYVRHIAISVTLDKNEMVPQPSPVITSSIVERALRDSENLLHSSGAVSAVDRMHTALHGYMRTVCLNANLSINEHASITELFKVIRADHPAFKNINVASEETKKLMGALSSIIDTLNSLRNNSSVAHPNEQLLDEPEAILAINCARSLFHYIDTKIK
jgi:hypothetical protein